MKKQKKKIKDLERGLVSVEDYQKIKSAVEGTDGYHAVLKESKRDFTKPILKKKKSIDELESVELDRINTKCSSRIGLY